MHWRARRIAPRAFNVNTCAGITGVLALLNHDISNGRRDSGNGEAVNIVSGVLPVATDNFVSYLPLTQTVTIDAQSKGRGVYIVNSASATIRDLHITNGNANNMGGDASGMDSGGGIYAYGSGVAVNGNTIFGNAAEAGGGVYLNNISCFFCFNNAILTNTATFSGGGVVLVDSPAVALAQNDISGNNATNAGGGVVLHNSGSIVQDNVINRNSAGVAGGGGMRLEGSDNATVSGNRFIQNSAGVGNAGAVFLERSSVTVAGNSMISNTAGAGGAMYIFFSNGGTVSGNIMRGNSSTGDGGGIVLHSTIIKLLNNVIVDNRLTSSTKKGSGIFVQQSAAHLLHNTIARNTGGDNSGLSFSTLVPAAPIVMTNTIIVNQGVGITTTAGNTATVRGVLWFGNGTNTTGAGPIAVTNAITGTPAFAADGYHIALGSTAIDNGINAGVTTDIDGEARPFGSAPDLGADELLPVPNVAITKIGPSLIISPANTFGGVPYRIILTNVGSLSLTNIVVTDTLPSGMQADSTVGVSCSALPSGAKCTVASLGIGATKVFTINTSVNAPPACGTLMTNQVVAAPAEGDVNLADNTATSQATFTCAKADQTITFAPLPDRTLAESPFTVSATASSGLPVTFTASPPSVCTLSGTTVTLAGLGACTITAHQSGDGAFNPAPDVARAFNVVARLFLPLIVR